MRDNTPHSVQWDAYYHHVQALSYYKEKQILFDSNLPFHFHPQLEANLGKSVASLPQNQTVQET